MQTNHTTNSTTVITTIETTVARSIDPAHQEACGSTLATTCGAPDFATVPATHNPAIEPPNHSALVPTVLHAE